MADGGEWAYEEVGTALRIMRTAIAQPQLMPTLVRLDLNDADFDLPGLRALWSAVLGQWREQGTVARDVVGSRLVDVCGDERARQVLGAVDTTDVLARVDDVDAVLDHMRRRTAVRRTQQVGARLTKVGRYDDPFAVIGAAVAELDGISRKAMPMVTTTGADLATIAEEELTGLRDSPVHVPTGFRLIDSATGGKVVGFTHLIIGKSGDGKSVFGRAEVVHAARAGFPVSLVTTETTIEDLARGLTSYIAGVEWPKDVSAIPREMMPAYLKATAELRSLPIYVDCVGSGCVDAAHVCRIFRGHRDRHGAVLGVVDYVQDLGPAPQFKEHGQLSHAWNADQFTALAKEKPRQMALTLLSQLVTNKDGTPAEEGTANAKKYYKAAVTARYLQRGKKATPKENLTRMNLSKNRFRGVRQQAWYAYDPTTTQFTEVDAEGRALREQAVDAGDGDAT